MKLALLFLPVALGMSGLACSDEVVDPAKLDRRTVDPLGKEYYLAKDHPFLSKYRYGSVYSEYLASFTKRPELDRCSYIVQKCDAISTTERVKFRVDAIVKGEGKPVLNDEKYLCPQSTDECFYRVLFNNSTTAYVKVKNFLQASSVSAAIHGVGFPGAFAIEPVIDSKGNPNSTKLLAKDAKRLGVQKGFTSEEVLMSQWGRPSSKSVSKGAYGTIEIWQYSSGSLTFVNNVVEELSTFK